MVVFSLFGYIRKLKRCNAEMEKTNIRLNKHIKDAVYTTDEKGCGKDIIDGEEVCGGNSYGQTMYCKKCQTKLDAVEKNYAGDKDGNL